MKLRYFVVGPGGQLRKASGSALKAFREGACGAAGLGAAPGRDLRLVTVVCDAGLLPRSVYLLRVPLTDGAFTLESRLTLQAFTRADCVTPGEALDHHLAGWPADFFPQLAVALDVPVAALNVPFGIGGPPFLKTALRVRQDRGLRPLP